MVHSHTITVAKQVSANW